MSTYAALKEIFVTITLPERDIALMRVCDGLDEEPTLEGPPDALKEYTEHVYGWLLFVKALREKAWRYSLTDGEELISKILDELTRI